ncbi:MAG: hypothetical protein KGD60_04970 [Candidatus Thorarchaeota archaeon]|nr:hypothetical protein [Candidatus Thorarchaeota archaeon]
MSGLISSYGLGGGVVVVVRSVVVVVVTSPSVPGVITDINPIYVPKPTIIATTIRARNFCLSTIAFLLLA